MDKPLLTKLVNAAIGEALTLEAITKAASNLPFGMAAIIPSLLGGTNLDGVLQGLINSLPESKLEELDSILLDAGYKKGE